MLRGILTFSLLLILSLSAWAQLQFSDRIAIPRSSAEVGVGDFDQDGFPDIAICNSDQRWYKGPDFTTWYSLGTSDGGPYAARVADINGDGWPDFVTSDGTRTNNDLPGQFYVYYNPGASGDVTGPWERVVVYTGNVRHQNDMRIIDMDGDGMLDIVERTWGPERIVVALQNPDSTAWTIRAFTTNESSLPEGLSAGDVDGDGDVELILSGAYWDTPDWRLGNPTTHVFDPIFYDNEEEVKSAVGDIDNDGDQDIYVGSAEGSFVYLAWYENMGTDSNGVAILEKHIIKDNFGKCHMVELIDIDKDGDLDLCTGRSFGEEGCIIFYNENNGESWTEQNYDPNGTLYTGIVADLDVDGDLDVVGPSKFYGTVYYYLNETPGAPPGPPTNLQVTLLSNGLDVQLSWSDTISNEGIFEIERKTEGVWGPLGSLPANSVVTLDTATSPGTDYEYRVRASNGAGSSVWLTSPVIQTWSMAGEVTMTPGTGSYIDPPVVTLSAEPPFDDIRYTTDGAIPTETSTMYQGEIMIDTTTQLKAAAFGANLIRSTISVADYQIAINGNFAPMADAGFENTFTSLDPIVLDGNGTTDLDDDLESLTFQWTQLGGPTVSIQNLDSVVATFSPNVGGFYSFELRVADEVAEDRDTVRITVTDLDEKLLAYWPMDAEDGNVVEELVSDYDGTRNGGASWSPTGGKVDGAMLFDGLSGRVSINPFDVPSDEMTIAMWINPANLDNVEARFISKANGTSSENHYWMVSANGGSQLRFRLKTENGGTTTLVSSTGQISPDTWTFVVARYDGAEMQLYRDTTMIAMISKTGDISQDIEVPIAIGNQPSGAGDRPFDGLIDDVRLYDSALSFEEIRLLYLESCSSYLLAEDLSIEMDMTLVAKNVIELKNISVVAPYQLTLKAPSVIIADDVSVQDGADILVQKVMGCH